MEILQEGQPRLRPQAYVRRQEDMAVPR